MEIANISAQITSVPVSYEKSPYCTPVLAEGAYGGVTNTGRIQFFFWKERNAIPTSTKLSVDGNGQIIKEEPVTGGNGLVRSLEADVTMDLVTAISFHNWLGDRIKDAQNRMNQVQANNNATRQ